MNLKGVDLMERDLILSIIFYVHVLLLIYFFVVTVISQVCTKHNWGCIFMLFLLRLHFGLGKK